MVSALAGLLCLPLMGLLFNLATNSDGPDLFHFSLTMAIVAVPVALITALAGVLVLWLIFWLPAFCFRRQLSYFWRPLVCTPVRTLLGLLLFLFLGDSEQDPKFVVLAEIVAAATAGAALFYLGFRFFSKSEIRPHSPISS